METTSSSMRKVFIPCPGSHDYSPAKRFGELTLMTTRVHHKYGTTMMYRDFYEQVLDSSPEDYLLVVGPTIQVLVAASMFAVMHGRLNILIYDREDYTEKTLHFNMQDKEQKDEA